MRWTKDRLDKRCAGIERCWNSQHRESGHLGHCDLDLSGALITGGVLLQAGILVNCLFAIALVIRVGKGHGRRLSGLDAGLCNADRLGEKHRCRDKAADCTTNPETAKNHKSLTSTE